MGGEASWIVNLWDQENQDENSGPQFNTLRWEDQNIIVMIVVLADTNQLTGQTEMRAVSMMSESAKICNTNLRRCQNRCHAVCLVIRRLPGPQAHLKFKQKNYGP